MKSTITGIVFLLISTCAFAEDNLQTIKHIKFNADVPMPKSTKLGTVAQVELWRGNNKARINAITYTDDGKPQSELTVIDEPNIWTTSSESKKFKHEVDSENDSDLHIPLITGLCQEDFLNLEMGQEFEYFQKNNAKKYPGTHDMYYLKSNHCEIMLNTENGSEIPKSIQYRAIGANDSEQRVLVFTMYEEVPYKNNYFKPVVNLK